MEVDQKLITLSPARPRDDVWEAVAPRPRLTRGVSLTSFLVTSVRPDRSWPHCFESVDQRQQLPA